MSFAFVQDVAATWEQYERVASAIAVRPDGLVLHLAGPTEEGFRIIGVWESKSAWERFEAELQLEHAAPGSSTPATFRALQPKHIVFGRLDTFDTTPIGSPNKLPLAADTRRGLRSGNDR